MSHSHPEVAGYVDGRAVPRALVDDRIDALRRGPRSAALPVAGSSEDRQLARWVAQVVLTEQLCEAEARARGLPESPGEGPGLDQRAAVELGSIYAAAYAGSAAVRAVYSAVTQAVEPPEEEVASLRRYRPAVPLEELRGQIREAARRRAFAHWLDAGRAARLTLVPGLEHPGDPHQPDNHHRH